MSKSTVTVNTGKQLFVDTDTSKIFIRANRYETDHEINNSNYDPIVLKAGTVMGRISASGYLAPFASNASDGTQFVVGILADDYSIEEGATKQVAICVAGDVAKDQIIFTHDGDAFETVVSGRRVYDKIKSEAAGIIIVDREELTNHDNS